MLTSCAMPKTICLFFFPTSNVFEWTATNPFLKNVCHTLLPSSLIPSLPSFSLVHFTCVQIRFLFSFFSFNSLLFFFNLKRNYVFREKLTHTTITAGFLWHSKYTKKIFNIFFLFFIVCRITTTISVCSISLFFFLFLMSDRVDEKY